MSRTKICQSNPQKEYFPSQHVRFVLLLTIVLSIFRSLLVTVDILYVNIAVNNYPCALFAIIQLISPRR
jgi:hypothetical protein